MRKSRSILPWACASVMMIWLAGCDANRSDTGADNGGGSAENGVAGDPVTGDEGGGAGDNDAPVSILRPDVDQPDVAQPQLAPLKAVIEFPDGGSQLDEAALAVLEEVHASEQLAAGGAIAIGGHSDSGGSDAVNLDVSQERALAVAAWLIERGVEDDRIDVIVFGEQNPVEPNALANGEPNEVGRALNRRVEIDIKLPAAQSEAAPQESAEAGD
ncbi:MAG: OmpA family protein [Erythrobacter sp.]